MRVIYIGRRGDAIGSQVFQVFIREDGKGQPLHYRGVKGLVLGGIYETKKGKISIRPAHLGDAPVKQEWIDAELAVSHMLARKREAAKALRIAKEHWDTLRPLHLRAQKLGLFERHEFAEAIARLIVRGNK